MKPQLTQRPTIKTNIMLTPQMQQSIRLLQMPITELKDKIEQELLDNPVLIQKDKHTTPIPFSSDKKYEPSLYEHLSTQIKHLDLTSKELEIADFLIGNINEDGFLDIDLDKTAKIFNLSLEEIKKISNKILFLDPIGIGATSLSECLLTQLKTLPKSQEVKTAINAIKKNLSLKNLPIIKKLDHAPGRKFSQEIIQHIIPDITIDSKNTIKLNNKNLPELKLSSEYKEILKDKNTSKETKSYIKEKIRSAEWVIKALDQREKTIYKISSFLKDHQKDFFKHGISHLKPLVLKDAALNLDIHESTVSRAISNKYIETPHGLFPLKYFFAQNKKVQFEIANIIKKEDKNKPLSDQKISEILKKEGIDVARRTVSKYRNYLKIPSTSIRRMSYTS